MWDEEELLLLSFRLYVIIAPFLGEPARRMREGVTLLLLLCC